MSDKIMIDTGLHSLWSSGALYTTETNFVPVTGPVSTTMVRTAKFSQYLESDTGNIIVGPAYQMSDDGINWTESPTDLSDYNSVSGWSYSTSAPDNVTTNLRLFVRFGFVAGNKAGGGGKIQSGSGRLLIEIEPTNGRSFGMERLPVWSNSDTTTTSGIFHPTTRAIPFEAVGEIRGTLEVYGTSKSIHIQPAYQLSNDKKSWDSGGTGAAEDSFSRFGSARTTNGRSAGTTFETFSPDEPKQWVRFGVACRNVTSAEFVEAAVASLRVDIRTE